MFQIYVGVITNLMVFPINFLLMFMFRKSRPRVKRPSRIKRALDEHKSESSSDIRKLATAYPDDTASTGTCETPVRLFDLFFGDLVSEEVPCE